MCVCVCVCVRARTRACVFIYANKACLSVMQRNKVEIGFYSLLLPRVFIQFNETEAVSKFPREEALAN